MANDPEKDDQLPAHLSVWDVVSIIIGIVVGTMIFETPPAIFRSLHGVGAVMAAWGVAGLLSLIGALCYAELATTYPRSGGDYVYLTRAYGRPVGFLFGWAQLAIILTASIGMLAFVFADYGIRLFVPEQNQAQHQQWAWAWASLPVVVLTLVNILGLRAGKLTQNVLTAVKLLGLAAIIIAGLFWTASPESVVVKPPGWTPDLATALVMVFLTYGGWNDAAYVAAEVRDVKRGIPRALILGVLAITGLYLLVNLAYLHGLGYTQAGNSSAVAADVLKLPLGAWGEKGMCVVVVISALGAINALIFAGARVCLSLGRDHALFGWLGRWYARRGTPYMALLTQAAITLLMIVVVGTPQGQQAMNLLFNSLGLAGVDWKGKGGFETLLRCTAPIFWLFFLLTAQSLFLLRAQDHDRPRPFSVPLFPWLPLIFCLTCSYMLFSGIDYAGKLGLVGAGLLVAGVPIYLLSEAMSKTQPVPFPAPVLPAPLRSVSVDGSEAIKQEPQTLTRRD